MLLLPRACFIFRDFLHPLNSGLMDPQQVKIANVNVNIRFGRLQLQDSPLLRHQWFDVFYSWLQECIQDERLLPDNERLFSNHATHLVCYDFTFIQPDCYLCGCRCQVLGTPSSICTVLSPRTVRSNQLLGS